MLTCSLPSKTNVCLTQLTDMDLILGFIFVFSRAQSPEDQPCRSEMGLSSSAVLKHSCAQRRVQEKQLYGKLELDTKSASF